MKFNRIILSTLFALISICTIDLAAQTKGLIYKPAGTGQSVLDPNLDGYTSSDANGFINEDEEESEIPYTPLPSVGTSEPDSDLGPGPSCGFTDLVKSDDNHTIYTYLDATDNLMFRFRLGGTASNSKSYSILIDTDQKFGATGANADPNYTAGNPGFEIEVVLRTNFGVGLYDIDGTTSATEIGDATVDRPYDNYAQKSIAHSEICGDDDYFYDFYIPFADITAAFPGITTSTPLRMVGQTVINPKEATGNNGISDLGGIDDDTGITEDLWEDLIDVFPPTSADDIGSGTTLPPRADCPTITGPIAVGANTVSGTASEVDGATIEVFRDGVSEGTTTVSSGNWSMTISPTVASEVFTAAASVSAATASSTGTSQKSASYTDCNESTVGATCSATISVSTSFTISNKGLCGDAGSAVAGAEVMVYYGGSLLTPSGGSNFSGGQIFAEADGSWVWKCNTNASCGSGGPCAFPTSGYFEIVQIESGKCASDPFEYCAGGAATSSAPVFNADPTTVSTSISGTATAGASIAWYLDDIEQAATTATGGSWTFSVSGLTVGQVVKVRSIESGSCSAETAKTVIAQSAAPIIQGDYCAPTAGNVTEVSGVTASGSGTTIEIFTASASGGPYTTTGSSIVTTGASWTVTGLSIPVGDFIVAKATGSGEVESDYSDEVEVFSQTVDASLAITTSPITEGDDAITGNSSLADGSIVYLYLDGFIADGFSSTVSSGNWTILGLSAVNAGYDVLYAEATVTVTSQSGVLCESDQSAGLTVQCNPPTTQTFSATSATQVCENETIDFQINSTENLIVYELVDQAGNGVGPAALGDGTALSLTSFGLSSTVTSIAVRAQKIGITCETTFSPAVSVDVKPLPVVSLTSSALQVCKGDVSVNLAYSVTSNGPAIDYSIDFDAAAEAAGSGFVDVTNNTTVASPISVTVPANAPAGTYNATFTIRNSNSLTCTSEAQVFTITVVDPVVGSATQSSPISTCAASDGAITIGGLATSTAYSALNYLDDGVTVNHGAFSSNTSGEYIITGLNAGSYTNFEVTVLGCTSPAFAGPVNLSDPGAPVIAEGTHTQPTNCTTPNGEIVLTGVTSGDFDVDYSLNGTPQTTKLITATASGIAITDLDEGTYTNLRIKNRTTNCQSNTITGPINLTNSNSPTITLGTSPSVSQGTTSANLPYTATTNSPNQYTIDFDPTAEEQGFDDVTIAAALPTSPISLVVPGAAAVSTYNGTITVINSGTGCSSAPVAFTVTVTSGATGSTSAVLAGDATICVGGSTNLSVTITGGAAPFTVVVNDGTSNTTYSSYNSGDNISVSPSNTTTYSLTSVTDNGGNPGTGNSGTATVTVNADPSISSQPTSVTECVGTSTTLSVTAAGGASGLTYQWQSSAISGGTFTNIGSATSTTYAAPTTSTGTTYYQVIVSDAGTGCGSVTSNEASVTVNADPSISSQPTSVTECVGTSTTLSVTAAGGASGLTYQWQSSAISGGTFTNIGSATSATYAAPTTSTGTTYYQVIVSDAGTGCGSVTSNEASVTVNADPSISSQPTSVTECVGTITTLSVTAAGGASGLTYQWQSSATSGGTFTNIGSATSATYAAPTTSTGTTYYQVIVSDAGTGCGSVTSNEASVTVNTDPSISSQPTSVTECVGTTTTLSVSTSGGVGGLTYQWQSSGSSGGVFSDIVGAMTNSYDAPTTSTGTTYYRVVVSDAGTGCGSVISSETSVTIVLSGCDSDGDGVADSDEDVDGDGDPTNDDTDGDGTPDYLDEDDDGDGINTEDEDIDGDGDPTNDDTDGDGTPDYLDEDDDGDGINTEDEDLDGDGGPTNDDCDNDGTPNYLDTDYCDSDGDGINDDDEDTDGDGDFYNDDCDNDGTPNFLDADPCDTDGDGLDDDDEDADGDGDPYNDDCDEDGIPNFQDSDTCDTDGDGVPDSDEDTDGDGDLNNDDCDEDGVPNYLDTDVCEAVTPRKGFTPDGDGINDFFFIKDIEFYPNNNVQIYNRWGNKIFEIDGYDNQSRVWSSESNFGLVYGDRQVPDGTYYYLINLGDGSKPISGFVVVNR